LYAEHEKNVPKLHLYADFERNLADKISKFGQEPSSASVTCAVTGPIVIRDAKKIRGTSGEDVFSEKKGLGFIQNKVGALGLGFRVP